MAKLTAPVRAASSLTPSFSNAQAAATRPANRPTPATSHLMVRSRTNKTISALTARAKRPVTLPLSVNPTLAAARLISAATRIRQNLAAARPCRDELTFHCPDVKSGQFRYQFLDDFFIPPPPPGVAVGRLGFFKFLARCSPYLPVGGLAKSGPKADLFACLFDLW